jgi:uncharacterized protein
MRIFLDSLILDGEPRFTADGYLVSAPRIARTGMQDYLAAELGLSGDPMRVIHVHRPESEVFSTDSMHSLAHLTVTDNHPRDLVNPKNWRQLTRGMSGGDVARDGEFIRVPMAIMDADSIAAIMAGKKELSVGYTADLDFTPGQLADGTNYDAVQKNIRGNHIAIVDRARGGRELRVIDHQPTTSREDLAMKQLIIDGITVNLDDTAHQVISKLMQTNDAAVATLKQTITDLQGKVTKLETQHATDATALQTRDAEITTLKQKVADSVLTPAKLDEAVRMRASVVDTARQVLPSVIVDGKTEIEIRRQVVDSKMGDKAKGWNDEQVIASFNTLTAGVVVDSVRQQHMHTNHQQPTTVADAHNKYLNDTSNAWRTGNDLPGTQH